MAAEFNTVAWPDRCSSRTGCSGAARSRSAALGCRPSFSRPSSYPKARIHLPGGSPPCFLGNQAHHVMDARRFVRPAVQLKEPGGHGQEVTMSVVETGRERRSVAVPSTGFCVHQGVEVLQGANGQDAAVLDGNDGRPRKRRFHGQDPGVVQQQVRLRRHGLQREVFGMLPLP